MTREELEESIRWEAEQYIPFDINEVNLDFQILDGGESEGQMDVLLVAAKKDLIDDYVQVITRRRPPARGDRRGGLRGRERLRGELRQLKRRRGRGAGQHRLAGREHQHRGERRARLHARHLDRRQRLHRRDPEGALGGLGRGRADQDRRQQRRGQPGRRAAGGRAGDAQRDRHGDRARSAARSTSSRRPRPRAASAGVPVAAAASRVSGLDAAFQQQDEPPGRAHEPARAHDAVFEPLRRQEFLEEIGPVARRRQWGSRCGGWTTDDPDQSPPGPRREAQGGRHGSSPLDAGRAR